MSSPSANGVAGRAGPAGWSLTLPPGWWHIPLDERRGQSVKALLDCRLASLPRDRVATLRRELEGELTRLAERAAQNDAVDMYLSVDLMRGLPVAATCLVTVVPTGVGTALPAAELAAMMGDRPDDDVGVLEVAGARLPGYGDGSRWTRWTATRAETFRSPAFRCTYPSRTGRRRCCCRSAHRSTRSPM